MRSKVPGAVERVNKELWVILSMFALALLLNQVLASQRMVLSLYVLPTIASSYFYGRRHGTLTAFASVLLVSGLLEGGADIAQRPAVIDVPHEKGHVMVFSPNPVWRGETMGSYAMVFNAILHFDHLDAGRKWDEK